MLTFEPSQFVEFLSGQTKPARFVVGGISWVFRYPMHDGQQLRLASEFMGYRVASWLDVSVPGFCLAQTLQVIEPGQSGLRVRPAVGTATRWIDDAQYPDLEHDPLEPFWKKDQYLRGTAAVRIADTWMMNFDRPRCGNVALRGNTGAPEVYFLDFDQAFLAKHPANDRHDRPHWIAADFQDEMLNDHELLSGLLSRDEAQRREHFDSAVQRLRSVTVAEVEKAVRDIPAQWVIGESDRRIWAKRLLARRKVVLEILKSCNLTNGCS